MLGHVTIFGTCPHVVSSVLVFAMEPAACSNGRYLHKQQEPLTTVSFAMLPLIP